MNTKTNIFFHATKELSTDAFIVWLIYFLDSDDKYVEYKQAFFDNLILKEIDRGRIINKIELKRQENNVDVILQFCFDDKDEKQTVLFEDKIYTTQHSNQLEKYMNLYPNSYRFFYYKLGYINSQEESEIKNRKFEIVDANMMASSIQNMIDLHPLIKMYYEYIKYSFTDSINSFHQKLFVENDYNVLRSADAQKYLCDIITENMRKQKFNYIEIRNGTSYGRPWTQIDIAIKTDGYWECLFWRVDIRAGKFYIRLNQYAEPSKEELEYKNQRLYELRKEANIMLQTMPDLNLGKVTSGLNKQESEVMIFFLKDNDINKVIEALPKISQHMVSVFNSLK